MGSKSLNAILLRAPLCGANNDKDTDVWHCGNTRVEYEKSLWRITLLTLLSTCCPWNVDLLHYHESLGRQCGSKIQKRLPEVVLSHPHFKITQITPAHAERKKWHPLHLKTGIEVIFSCTWQLNKGPNNESINRRRRSGNLPSHAVGCSEHMLFIDEWPPAEMTVSVH